MSSSATGVGMTICFLGAILLILTQKSSQKFGDVLGILVLDLLLPKHGVHKDTARYVLSNSKPFGLLSKILVLIWKICFEITHLLNMSHKLGHLSRIFAVEINKTRCYDIKRITRLAFVRRNCTIPYYKALYTRLCVRRFGCWNRSLLLVAYIILGLLTLPAWRIFQKNHHR